MKKGWKKAGFGFAWISVVFVILQFEIAFPVFAAEKKEGKVDIELQEYELDADGREIPYQDEKMVLPGDTISKIPRITNKEDPCYIRVQWDYTNDSQEEGISDENIGGISEDWVKKEGYLYYTKVLEKDTSVDLFQTIYFPKEWTEAHSLQKIDVPIVAEAIGLGTIEPDYEKEDPWDGESGKVVKAIKTGDMAQPLLFVLLIIICGSTLLYLVKKKGAHR